MASFRAPALGIRFKFIVLILIILLLIFAAVALILVNRSANTLRQNLETEAKTFSALATKPIGEAFILYQNSGRLRINQEVGIFTALDKNIVNVAVFDITGRLLFSQNEGFDSSLSVEQAASFEPIYQFDTGEEFEAVVYPFIEDFGQHRYTMLYTISAESVRAEIAQVVRSIILSTAIGLLLSAAVTLIAINRLFLQPLRQVTDSALAISAGKLHQKISLARQDEIGSLASAVSQMADSLQADITKLQEVDKLKSEFMMIASHNLRTPISIISGLSENMKALKLNAEIKRLVDMISANNHRLGAFAEDMLTVARIEAGDIETIRKQPTDITKFVREIAAEFSALASTKSVNFKASLPQNDLFANIGSSHFRSAVWNLLDNALKFTASGGTIELKLWAEFNSIKLSVSDSGIGIAAKELPKLFTKFHRGTSTLEYNYEGTGIGLYVTKLILEQMDGKIDVHSQLGKGSTFTIILPQAPPSQ